MTNQPNISLLSLNKTTTESYCSAFENMRHCGYWWYFLPNPILGNYSKPFKRFDHWWFQVKPGMVWSAHGLENCPNVPSLNFGFRGMFGFQYPVSVNFNSHLVFNLIPDLQSFDLSSLESSKIRSIKKAQKFLHIDILDSLNDSLLLDIISVWDSHVKRTRWKHPLSASYFRDSWNELQSTPGTTILGCFKTDTGQLIAWLIVKIIDSVAYIDTIASHSDFLELRPNDFLIYTFLQSSKNISSVKTAHYSLKSNLHQLERFKESLGFRPVQIPTLLNLNPVVKRGLKVIFPRHYARLTGVLAT